MSFSTVSVVGSGPVGCRIALACAAEGMPVVLLRASRGELEVIRTRLARRLGLAVERGELDPVERARIEARIEVSSDLARVADADLVVDATPCDPRARRALLATVESRMSGGAVLATAAPAESLAQVAEVLRRPDQLVAIRFEGAAVDLAVELAVLPETAPGVVAAARGFCARLRRPPLERETLPTHVGYREWLSTPAAAE
jgi:3-hydroxybutyryl-CoA dehydrogenase